MKTHARDYDIAGIVSQSPWFLGLPEKALARLIESARIRSYRKNSYLYTSGEMGSEVFCLLSGRVRLLLTSAIGQEYAVTDYDPGTWLGGEFLSGDNPARLDVQIHEAVTVLTLPRALVLDVANQHPQVFKNLFADYMVRFSGLMLLLQSMAFYPLRSRLAFWLIELFEKHGHQESAGIYLDEHLSQNDIRVNCLAPTAGTAMTEGLFPEEVFKLMAPESVSPAVVFLSGPDAPSRKVLCAGGGSFAVFKGFETEGMSLLPGDVSPEGVAAVWDELNDEKGMRELSAGFEQPGKFAEQAARKLGLEQTG